jgi:hypothetical protein
MIPWRTTTTECSSCLNDAASQENKCDVVPPNYRFKHPRCRPEGIAIGSPEPNGMSRYLRSEIR